MKFGNVHIAVSYALILGASALGLSRCSTSPYRAGETAKETFYQYVDAAPSKFDPATSYYHHESQIIENVFEPPFEYHFLKRPYEIGLIPRTAEEVPEPVYTDAAGQRLSGDPPAAKVARAEYLIRIKPGILYADHPCFARDAQGRPLYRGLKEEDVRGVRTPYDFPKRDTREVTAEDYVRGIRRLADPRLPCPILTTLQRCIAGFSEYGDALGVAIEAERERRKTAGGPGFDAAEDDRLNPFVPDYLAGACPGIEVVDRHSFRIVLKRKYPQIRYWMAMHFFSPIPQESLEFYAQGPLIDRGIVLNRWPIGTGPYYIRVMDPNRQIVFERNPRYRDVRYPSEGEESDRANGFLDDAGKRIPFCDRVVVTLEKEAIPLWSKFQQGYYDYAGVTPEAFEQTIRIGSSGDATLSEDMKARGVRMFSTVTMRNYWIGFNMLDDVVGGYTPEKAKLRQAVSIALDYNEFLDIFYNGQGVVAQGPLPPGLFGSRPGEAGVNPYVDRWDAAHGRAVRRPIADAQRLMAEAGYPDGRTPDGRPLVLYLDHGIGGEAEFVSQYNWMRSRLQQIGVDLQDRGTDLRRFREKMDKGQVQVFRLGWIADYPDPENFLFLFYGPNSKAKTMGENNCNYENAEYDRLFEQVESMINGPERQALIDRMVEIVRRDAAVCFGYHPLLYRLNNAWYANGKPHEMTQGTLKYYRVDPARRVAMQRAWNRPAVVPVLAVEALLLAAAWPVIARRRREEAAC